jgi:hypothetical protein
MTWKDELLMLWIFSTVVITFAARHFLGGAVGRANGGVQPRLYARAPASADSAFRLDRFCLDSGIVSTG